MTHPNTLAAGWTDERVERLTKLWLDGLSASQIAKQLRGVTRNAVIGKVNRLGLEGREAPYKPGAPARPKRAPPVRRLRVAGNGAVFAVADAQAPTVVIPFREEPPGIRTILTIAGHGECRWPIGSIDDGSFTFCGQSTPDGKAYCASHHARGHQPSAPRKVSTDPFVTPVRARFGS